MTSVKEKVIDRIKAMLNLAKNDAAAIGEVQNAVRFVNKLMEEHQLTEEDLGKAEEKILDLENAEFDRCDAWFNGHKHSTWESNCAHFACALVGGVKWYYRDRVLVRDANGIMQTFKGKRGPNIPLHKTRATFYGIAEDAEMASMIFTELVMTIAAAAMLKWGGVYRGNGRDYCEGFVAGIWDKYYRDRDSQIKLAHSKGTGTALMVIDKRKEIVAQKEKLATIWLEEQVKLKLGKGRSRISRRKGYSHEAHAEGRADGSRYSADGSRRKKLS